jgi:hypothetical protein
VRKEGGQQMRIGQTDVNGRIIEEKLGKEIKVHKG